MHFMCDATSGVLSDELSTAETMNHLQHPQVAHARYGAGDGARKVIG